MCVCVPVHGVNRNNNQVNQVCVPSTENRIQHYTSNSKNRLVVNSVNRKSNWTNLYMEDSYDLPQQENERKIAQYLYEIE